MGQQTNAAYRERGKYYIEMLREPVVYGGGGRRVQMVAGQLVSELAARPAGRPLTPSTDSQKNVARNWLTGQLTGNVADRLVTVITGGRARAPQCRQRARDKLP